jgi:ABC-type polysaccharide/polyol phosphate transport system ATPase subunit
MSSEAKSLDVRGLTKTYRLGIGRARIREALPPPVDRIVARAFPRWWRRDTFDALHDVSFSAPKGSSVALVGHNGAGKTTMLKVIAGVTAPTRGSVSVSGRVAALIDVLVGFHPDLTGRENVYLLGAIQGYGRKEMTARLDRIMGFAEIEDLADTPLKRYSAGMVTRIAFATIAALDVDVLLIDEVLAVGDAAFQRKCVQWLEGYQEDGGTLLFVSHNLGLVRSMTREAIWLDHGRVMAQGPTPDILAEYGAAMERRDEEAQTPAKGGIKRVLAARGLQRWGAGGARLLGVKVGEPSSNGEGIELVVSFEAPDLDEGVICVGFIDESGYEVAAAESPSLPLGRGTGSVACRVAPLPLRPGLYFPAVGIMSGDGVVRDRWQLDRPISVDVDRPPLSADFGVVALGSEWREASGLAEAVLEGDVSS